MIHQTEASSNITKTCKFCNKLFYGHFALKQHEMTHTGERKFACELCDQRFMRKCILQQHQLTHPELNKRRQGLTCGVCSKNFPHAHALKRHQLIYAGDPQTNADGSPICHQCEECGKKFHRASALNK